MINAKNYESRSKIINDFETKIDLLNNAVNFANTQEINEMAKMKNIDKTAMTMGLQKIKTINDLLKKYSETSIDKGYGLSRRDLKQKDIVDMRECTELINDDRQYKLKDKIYKSFKEYQKQRKNYFYEIVPCFSEGSFYMIDNTYLYWKILDLKPEENTITLKLMSYAVMESYWSVGTSCVATISNDDPTDFDEEFKIETNEKESYSRYKLYSAIPYSELKWSKSDIKLWEKHVSKVIKKSEKLEKQKGNTPFTKLITVYLDQVSLLNFILETNKPKAKRTINNKNKIKIQSIDVEQPKRITRTVGLATIKSHKIPRPVNAETIIHYKIANWKTRGHNRILKSGKIIHVSESIHHRKCLENKNKTPQTTLILK